GVAEEARAPRAADPRPGGRGRDPADAVQQEADRGRGDAHAGGGAGYGGREVGDGVGEVQWHGWAGGEDQVEGWESEDGGGSVGVVCGGGVGEYGGDGFVDQEEG